MFSKLLPRRHALARLLTISCACALPAALAAPAAHASTGGAVARMAVAAPHASTVSGSIWFAARHVRPGARKVVFAVDGGHRWTALRAPYRYHRTGMLNTRQLRNGPHMLTVTAVFPGHRVRVARQRVVVQNHPARNHRRPRSGANAGVAVPPAGGVGGPSVALFNRETFKFSSSLSLAAEASRYQVMALQSTDASKVPALKAANPNLKILVYQDITLSRTGDTGGWTVCTSWTGLQANHPDWFVKDQNGNPIPDKAYPGNFIMDVGNPAYQQACIAHAISVAKQAGFDGLYLDDVTSSVSFVYPAGISSPQYPTNASWQSAMYSMITYAAAQIHSNGMIVMGNIGGAFSFPGLWQRWNAPLDGAEEQGWNDRSQWSAKLADAAWSEANGKYLLLGSYDTTETGNTFGLASMLLVARGKTSYSTSNANLTSDEAWYPEYDAARRLGAAAGAYRQLANGVYERVFANGIVLVNPGRQAAQTFSLGGAQFTGSGLSNVGAAMMAPRTALILLRVG